jgi:hypothetical protein
VLHRRWRGRPVGRWSSAAALQGEAANHRKVRRSRAGVLSVCGKVAPQSAAGVGQEGERKRSTDDVSKRSIDDIETRPERTAWDEPGGSLPTGQAVSGMEVARAWSGLRCGTCEPVVPRPRAASGAELARGRARKREPQAADPRGAE